METGVGIEPSTAFQAAAHYYKSISYAGFPPESPPRPNADRPINAASRKERRGGEATVNTEIGIGREDHGIGERFGHATKAGKMH